VVNVKVGPYEVDFLWTGVGLIVETDGGATHGTRSAFELDRVRDAELQARGYHVVRFTYWQVTAEPEYVARVLREVFARLAI
jgi:very-short-patch-repair endonuclease